jgi:hypothetical protein
MSTMQLAPEVRGLGRSTALVLDEVGSEWLATHGDLVSDFLGKNLWEAPEECFSAQGDFVGMGMNANVYSVGGIALKVVTPLIGRIAYKHTRNPRLENLVRQSEFMTALNNRLEGFGITLPKQHFAIKAPGRSLKGEELLENHATPFIVSIGLSKTDRDDFLDTIEGRVNSAIGHGLLSRALDIGLNRNILIPRDTEDPSTTPISLIDQPHFERQLTRNGLLYKGLIATCFN